MSTKRMRVFAGPNGSGKTTIVKKLAAEIPFGVYVNADDIEQSLTITGALLFNQYQLKVEEKRIQDFFRNSLFAPVKRNEPDLWQKLSVKNNTLFVNAKIDSYLAADIAEFIRQQLLNHDISFTYETVMSHESKISFMQKALKQGYRVYLYFIATEDPEINVSRVNARVAQEGHAVDPDIIRSRFHRSMKLLKSAVLETNRAYIFDNSTVAAQLIAEITEGTDIQLIDTSNVPNWVVEHLLPE
jgi:predicted ABC-type ATPase